MRTPVTIFALALVALCPIGIGALAQQQHAQPSAPASNAGSGGTAATSSDASTAVGDAAATAAADPDAGATPSGPTARTFDLPMAQRGTGAVTYYPIPEQLTRSDAPVFAQVRTMAPLDHVSLFYRGRGGRRFTEVRMNAMGADQGLAGGYGAMIPCEDTFPPAVEYYVVALDTSGSAVGSAGTEDAPLTLPIVNSRHFPIVPTLPGQPPPRNCGALVTATTTGRGNNGATGATGAGTSGADAGASQPTSSGNEPTAGSADLGEPCTRTEDCHSGLRCGSTHRCVFPSRR